MPRKPKTSIVILTWNGLEDTKAVLKDVAKLETRGFKAEAIVVDNGSKDNTQEELKDFNLPNMGYKFIKNSENLGFAGGNNVGIKDAIKRGADFVVLLNNDVILKKDLLVKLVEIARKNKKIGLLAPKMYFAKGYEFHKKILGPDGPKDRYKKEDLGKVIWYAGGIIDWDNIYTLHKGVDEVDKGQYDKQEETDVVNGACALIRKELMEDIGYLDEKYFLYWEDADLSVRAKRAGWKVVYTPATCLWHKVSVATGGSGSASNDYFLTRNRLYFGMKYASLRTKLALIKDSVRLAFKGRKWQRKAVIDFYLGRFGKGSWGK
jgi:hypothetical protein